VILDAESVRELKATNQTADLRTDWIEGGTIHSEESQPVDESMTMMFDPGKAATSLSPRGDTNAHQVCLEPHSAPACVGQPQAYSEVE
jgi:hypothetical protein